VVIPDPPTDHEEVLLEPEKTTVQVDRDQLVELRNAVSDRITNLRRIRGQLEKSSLSTVQVDDKLELLEGTDMSVGLKRLLAEQIDMFETGFDAGMAAGSPPPPEDDEDEEAA
jgi:hypothetical protein